MEGCHIFCRYKRGEMTKEELRVLLDLHEEEEYKILCALCSEEIKF